MAFALSGSVITQSGTDADLSALGSTSGVTSIASAGLTLYNFGGNSLTIAGTLTIDPRKERIINATNVTVNSGGTFNVGIAFTTAFGGGALFTQGDAVTFQGIFTNNGTFNQRGAAMVCSRTTAAAFHTFNNTTLMKDAVWRTQSANNHRLRMVTNQLDIDGLITEGVQFDALMTPSSGTILRKISPRDVGVGIENALAGGSGSTAAQVFDGVPSSAGKVSAFTSNWQGLNDLKLYAVEQGSGVLIMPDSCGNATTSGHGGLVYHRFKIKTQTVAGGNIRGAKVYVKDTNNGARKIKNIKNNTPIDKTADQVFTLTTGANGETALTDILTCHQYRDNAVSDISAPDGNEIRDIRGKNNIAGDDKFDVMIAAYGYDITTLPDVVMKGLNATEETVKLLPDAMISQSDKGVVDAYTSLNSAAKLYDYAKSHLVTNYAGQTQTYITRVGNLVNARAMNVEFVKAYSATDTYVVGNYVHEAGGIYKCATDVTVAEAFTAANWTSKGSGPLAVDNTTLLVNSGNSFAGSLITTGIITKNTTAISGSIEDSSGVRVTLTGTALNVQAYKQETSEITPGVEVTTQTNLGFSSGVSSVTYTLPRGVVLQYAVWALGHDAAFFTYDTTAGGAVIDVVLNPNTAPDTALDVTSIMENITTSLTSGEYNILFGAALTANLETIKAVMHRLLGQENALKALVDASGVRFISVAKDEIAVTRPVVFLKRSTALSTSDRIDLNGYFNFDAALADDASYVPNPDDVNGKFVNYLPVKPDIDPSVIAKAVQSVLTQDLTATKIAAITAAANTTRRA